MNRHRLFAPALLLWLAGCATLPAPPPLAEQARAAQQAGRLDEAAALYRQLAEARQTLEPWFRLGVVYAEQDRLEAAEWAFRQGLRFGDDPRLRHNLGLVRLRLGMRNLLEARRELPAADPMVRESRLWLRELLEHGL